MISEINIKALHLKKKHTESLKMKKKGQQSLPKIHKEEVNEICTNNDKLINQIQHIFFI